MVSILVKALPWLPCATDIGEASDTVTQRRKHTTTPLAPLQPQAAKQPFPEHDTIVPLCTTGDEATTFHLLIVMASCVAQGFSVDVP